MWCKSAMRFLRAHSSKTNLNLLWRSSCNNLLHFNHNRYISSAVNQINPLGISSVFCRIPCPFDGHFTRMISSEAKSETDSEEKSEPSAEVVNVVFVTSDGEEIKVQGKVGDNVLQLALGHDVSCEGACEGQLACTTCHVYVDDNYSQYIEEPVSEEEDLLDNAPFLKPSSRLSCQLHLTKEMEGIHFTLPPATINFFVDGHKPSKH